MHAGAVSSLERLFSPDFRLLIRSLSFVLFGLCQDMFCLLYFGVRELEPDGLLFAVPARFHGDDKLMYINV